MMGAVAAVEFRSRRMGTRIAHCRLRDGCCRRVRFSAGRRHRRRHRVGKTCRWPAGPVFADVYTTVLRGIPDLLVVYLFYFGGSMAVTGIFNLWGQEGFVGVPPFIAGAAAIGVVSGAYQAEVFRGAFRVLAKGEIEAGKSVGMNPLLLFRRIIAPQVFRHALPGIGNVWQMALKESALISVTGLVELLRQAQIAAGSTRKPFEFYLIAGAIFLVITWLSQRVFSWLEKTGAAQHVGRDRLMDPLFIRDSFLQLLTGVPLTLELTALAFVIGLILATLIALIQVSGLHVLRIAASAYVFVIRGTPLLVQIFLIYYGLSQFRPTLQNLGLWQFFREAYWCGILALSLNSAAYGSEVIRGGLQSVSRREIEAARGLRHVGLSALSPDHPADSVAPGPAGLWQRTDPDGEGDVARLDHHHDGSHWHCRAANFGDVPAGGGLHRRRHHLPHYQFPADSRCFHAGLVADAASAQQSDCRQTGARE